MHDEAEWTATFCGYFCLTARVEVCAFETVTLMCRISFNMKGIARCGRLLIPLFLLSRSHR